MAREYGQGARTPHQRRAPKKGGGLFDDLSAAQVSAGALAAATSMLLFAYIGIVGSVIGVAVGLAASVAASQAYKKFLQASADKPREAVLFGGGADTDAEEGPADAAGSTGAAEDCESCDEHAFDEEQQSGGAPVPRRVPIAASRVFTAHVSSVADALSWGPKPRPSEQPTWVDPADSAPLQVLSRSAVAERLTAVPPQPDAPSAVRERARETRTPRLSDPRVQADATIRRVLAERAAKRRVQRRVIVVSVASALAAVMLTAGAVALFTNGAGIGPRPVVTFDGVSFEQSVASSADVPDVEEGAADQQPDDPSDGIPDQQPNDGDAGEPDGTGAPDGSEGDDASGSIAANASREAHMHG